MLTRISLVVALLAYSVAPAAARIVPDVNGNYFNQTTNPPTADLNCIGGRVRGNVVVSNTEVCQDYLGDMIATSTSGAQNLGTAAIPWQAVYVASMSNTGLTNTGTAGTMNAAGTSGTAGSQWSNNGLTVYVKTQVGTGTGNLGVYVSTIVPVSATYETVISSGGPIVMTSIPNISTTTFIGGTTELPSGTLLVLSSTAPTNSVTFQDGGTLSGSQLQLGASGRAVSQYKTLTLIYDATVHMWLELAYGNN